MNVKLFQSQDRQGFLVNINMDYVNSIHQRHDDMSASIQILLDWFEKMHYDIFWDIEANDVDINEFEEGFQIVFSGDNGIIELDQVEVESIH